MDKFKSHIFCFLTAFTLGVMCCGCLWFGINRSRSHRDSGYAGYDGRASADLAAARTAYYSREYHIKGIAERADNASTRIEQSTARIGESADSIEDGIIRIREILEKEKAE